ncbi:MAG: hypothetical protein JRI82_12560 [Deltaproteobacteria bacterium]|nr:hypothetical protein [Deltaproteobacteria bacterium]
MKTFSFRHLLLLACGIIGLGFLAMPAFGQDVEKMQELQRVIEVQQKQLEAQQKQLEVQQKQLDAQRQLLQEVQSQIESLAKDADKEAVTVTAKKPPAKQPADAIKAPPPKRVGLSNADKHDQDSPTSSNVTYFDPAKVINIPGTNTSIGLHGLLEFQIIHDSVGINNNRFDTATIPVDGGPSQTKFSVNPTQLAISSATPVPEGQLNTMISMDFNGKVDSPEPRLRIAYAEFVSDDLGLGLLGGQAYATMLDMSAVPETLDFAMPAGIWQTRQPMVRFTKSHAEGMITEVAIETPENVSYINADKLTRWPDLAVAGTWLVGGEYVKHVRLAGLARDLRAQGANGSTDSALGWAVTGSAKLGLPFLGSRDNFKIVLHYGDGYGTQIKGGPQEGAFNPVNSELETIGIFGTYGGIQHFWSEQWRSNLVYGYVNSDNPDFLSGDTYDNTNYVAADLIWNPYKPVDLGVEYLWGRRENKDGASGTSNRLLFTSKVKF